MVVEPGPAGRRDPSPAIPHLRSKRAIVHRLPLSNRQPLPPNPHKRNKSPPNFVLGK